MGIRRLLQDHSGSSLSCFWVNETAIILQLIAVWYFIADLSGILKTPIKGELLSGKMHTDNHCCRRVADIAGQLFNCPQ